MIHLARPIHTAMLTLLILGAVNGGPAIADSDTAGETRPSAREHEADRELAWQAFMGAGQVEDAYQLTATALSARPGSVLWHERRAQAAIQSNHPQQALEAYYWLITRAHQTRRLATAIDLAEGLGDEHYATELLSMRLARSGFDPQRSRELVDALLNLGRFDQALSYLRDANRRHPRPFYLREQARVYQTLANPQAEASVWRTYIRRYGPAPDIALRLAQQDYVRGDFEAAYGQLLSARKQAAQDDKAYWQALSGLAWMLQDFKVAADASDVLIRQGNADRLDYQRLFRTRQSSDPEGAFKLAEQGWQATRSPELFLDMLAVAARLNPASHWLGRAFKQLDSDTGAELQARQLYWTSLANWQASSGQVRAASQTYGRALNRFPGSQELLAGYLWLLLDTDQRQTLRNLLARVAGSTCASCAPSVLRAPVAAAFSRLGQPQRALPLLAADLSRHQNDPGWLMDYADTLSQADRPEAAYRWRQRAWRLLRRHASMPPDKEAADGEAQARRELATLALTLAPGDPARRLIQALARHPEDPRSRELVLAWMLDNSAQPLARLWIWRTFTRQTRPPHRSVGTATGPADTTVPDWANLALALQNNDGPVLADLLADDADNLPRRDRVSAAQTLGWDSLATTLAYQGAAGEPDDDELHSQFRDLALSRSDSVALSLTDARQGGLQTLTPQLAVNHWLTDRTRITGITSLARQRVDDTRQFGSVPTSSPLAQATLEHRLERGQVSLQLGQGNGLAPYTQLGVHAEYPWQPWLDSHFDATLGGRATASTPLYLGALEDRLELGLTVTPTGRDAVDSALHLGHYRAQGGGELGQTLGFDVAYSRDLWLQPPATRLMLSVSGARFQAADTLPPRLRTLVPDNREATTDFFIPGNYLQSCGGASVNDRFRRDYSERLRLFASTSVCLNSRAGLGLQASAGAALPVLGPDHLALSVDWGDNVGAVGASTLQVELGYRYYFEPFR